MPSESNHETTSAALWLVMARAYRAMASFVEHSVAALGIGLSDFMILEALLHKGPMTMSALCDAVLLARPSMTSAIDRLEELKLVQRVFSKEDRRARTVELTAAGTAQIKRLYARHLRDLDEVMKETTAAERAEVRRVLKTVGLAAQASTPSTTR